MTTGSVESRRAVWPIVRGHLARVPWRGALVEAAVVLVVFAAAGVAAAWLWHAVATPPQGTVFEGEWVESAQVRGDFLVLDFDDLGRSFGVVGWFAVIGLLAGAVLGVLAALLCRRSEVVNLIAVAGGSALAAYLCFVIGGALGPTDPDQLAADARRLTVLPGALSFDGTSPLLTWTLGALVGLALTYLLTTGVDAGRTELERLESDERRWLSRNHSG